MSERVDPEGDDAAPVRLWFTPDRARFYLIAAATELGDGAVELRSLFGGTELASAEALEPCEVSRVAAAAHVDEGWADAVAEVRDTWRRVVGAPRGEGPPDLSRFLGVSPGEAIVDLEKRRDGRRSLVDRVGRFLRPKAWDDDRLERTEAQLDRFGDRVRRAGRALSEEAGKLADTLDEQRPGVERVVRSAGEALVDVSEQAVGTIRRAVAPDGEE